MSEFPGILLTNAGLNMISESQASKTPLIITCVKMGDGKLSDGEVIPLLTAMKNPLLTAAFTSYENKGNGEVMIRFLVSNSGLAAGFFARELGVYAKLSETGAEQLYAYTNAGNLVDWVPDKNTPYDDQIIDLYVVTGNASSVQITMSSAATVTVYDLQDHNTSADAHKSLFDSVRSAIANIDLSPCVKFAVGGTMTAVLNLVTPAANDDSQAGATTGWVRSAFQTLLKAALDATGMKYLLDTNGYICFGSLFGGLILQWGTTTQNNITVSFPLIFQAAVYSITGTVQFPIVSGSACVSINGVSTSTFQVGPAFLSGNNGNDTSLPVRWIAIGK